MFGLSIKQRNLVLKPDLDIGKNLYSWLRNSMRELQTQPLTEHSEVFFTTRRVAAAYSY